MKATYHQEAPAPPITLVVLKKNADGTLDLGRSPEELIIGSCPVSDEPQPGFAVLEKEEEAPDKKSDKKADKKADA